MNAPKGCITIQELSFFLQKKGIKTGPQLLFRQLRDFKLLNNYNIPFKEYQANGCFVAVDNIYNHTVVGATPYCRVFVTLKGIEEIQKLFNGNADNTAVKEGSDTKQPNLNI